MISPHDLEYEARRSLIRVLPRLSAQFVTQTDAETWAAFMRRLDDHFPRLFQLLLGLYGQQHDFYYHLEQILEAAAQAWLARPADLKSLDAAREADPLWFQSNRMLGGVCYVDLFAGGLAGVRARLPYFKELGLTYLHLMPLFRGPAGNSDGGYAVSSYREVNPALGSLDELRSLAAELRQNGISLALDFVFNHTSDEHDWARQAQAGEPEYREFYFLFPDRQQPDAYERSLREIFPDEHAGAFTFRPEVNAWVWTTFHTFQWDLNYGNPAVFTAMARELLFLANLGVEVLRLDAVAFIWKRLGTSCENLPEAHQLIQAFNALVRIAAPALLFKSEAIVHPDDVARYINPEECQLSYNPLLMALLWSSLATRETRLLAHSMRWRFHIDPACAWVNYVRVHDDIGWTFSDDDAAQLGINGYDHRQFLNAFYTGRFPGSFARGLPFQENPKTGDMRISGAGASLAGLEKALREETAAEVELALRRILLIHGVILSLGGLPLLYLGDEVGALNDYSFRDDPAKAGDSRWVHRPRTDWDRMARRLDPSTGEGALFQRLGHLIAVRASQPALAGAEMEVLDTGSNAVFGYARQNGAARLLALANFSEQPAVLDPDLLRRHGLAYTFTDLVTGASLSAQDPLALASYQFVWLVPQA